MRFRFEDVDARVIAAAMSREQRQIVCAPFMRANHKTICAIDAAVDHADVYAKLLPDAACCLAFC